MCRSVYSRVNQVNPQFKTKMRALLQANKCMELSSMVNIAMDRNQIAKTKQLLAESVAGEWQNFFWCITSCKKKSLRFPISAPKWYISLCLLLLCFATLSVSQMSRHRKGFFLGQVRSPTHAEWSLLLLSIIVTILQKILEESRVTLKCQNQKVTEWVSEWQRHLLSCSGQLKSPLTLLLHVSARFLEFNFW